MSLIDYVIGYSLILILPSLLFVFMGFTALILYWISLVVLCEVIRLNKRSM